MIDLRNHRLFFLCCVFLFYSQFIPALAVSTPDFLFTSRVWQTEDGLPQDAVRAIAQTTDGYLWLGTTEGVARFDGLKFTVFNPRNTPELTGYSITALCALRDGSLWIGTSGSGLTRYKDGRFTHFDAEDGFVGGSIQALAGDKLGNLWIATASVLGYFKDNQFSYINHQWGLASDNITALCESSIGTIIGTANGLSFFRGARVEADATANLFPGHWITVIHEDASGHIWIGTRDHGLIRFKDNVVERFTFADGLLSDSIRSIHHDREDVVWVGSNGGLNRFVNGKLVGEPIKPAYSTVFSIFQDREANLWIGADEGLARLTQSRLYSYTTENGLPHNRVLSICEDQQGAVWMATWGGGLIRFYDGKFSQVTAKDGLINEFLPTVLADRAGQLWAGTVNNGIACRTEGQWMHYNKDHGLPNLIVRTVYQDTRDQIWVGTANGLARWQEERFVAFTNEPNLIVRAIVEDRDESLWLGTTTGLRRLQNDTIQKVDATGLLTNQPILSLHVDDENVLWIGTDRAGLHRWHNGQLVSYTTEEGLFNDTIYQILEDDGKLWMSCRHGIFSVTKTDLNDYAAGRRNRIFSRAYGKADGMASSQGVGGSQPAGCKTRDGKLWFATSKGVAVMDVEATIPMSSLPPPVVIEEIIADKKTVQHLKHKARDRGAHGSTLNLELETLNLPAGRGALEFHYTALSFVAPEKNQFKYKLVGYDRDWVEAGTRRVAYYNNLPPGSYTFQVVACNNDGVWNSQGSNVRLSLLPHFWQTLWFFGVCGLGAVGLVGGTARYITKQKLQRQLQRLEQQHAIEKERTRIAQDMHDDLGAKLSEILLVTDLSRKKEPGVPELRTLVERTAGSVRELVDTLDAIVWAVNPRNDSLEKFALYVSEYVQMYLKATSIRYSLNIPGELPDYMLSSEVRHNLFLVIKEALHNIVKHAQASKVAISLRSDAGTLTVTIEDDGKGFLPEHSSTFGNGLQNMEDRMKNSDGTFALSSKPGKGTRIQLQVPMGNDGTQK